jgi:hypothetical protein
MSAAGGPKVVLVLVQAGCVLIAIDRGRILSLDPYGAL